MGSALARKHVEVARPLKVLIPLIRADIEAGERAGSQYYADAGDKLIEAKESGQIAHGSWGPWLRKNFDKSADTARLYMRMAEHRATLKAKNVNAIHVLPTLNQMTGNRDRVRDRRDRVESYESIIRDVEPETYAIERQRRADEVQLHRDMAFELIDIGYKALATRLHPELVKIGLSPKDAEGERFVRGVKQIVEQHEAAKARLNATFAARMQDHVSKHFGSTEAEPAAPSEPVAAAS